MHQVDIKELEDKYIVIFEMPKIREENILIKGENDSLNVIAINKTITTEMKEENLNTNINAIIFNKTVIVENADFKNMTHTFFAGWLEIIVPKNKERAMGDLNSRPTD